MIIRKKGILIFDKSSRQRLEHTLSAGKIYSINFTEHNKTFCLRLHYNGENKYLFVNSTEIYKFKAKDSEIAATHLYLRNIPKDFSVDNVKYLMDMFIILVLIMMLLQLMIC